MAVTAYCSICRRTIYVDEGGDLCCPVCASSVTEVAEAPEDDDVAVGRSSHRRPSERTAAL